MKSIEASLLEGLEAMSKEGGSPEKLWHPDVGWVDLKDPTPAQVQWLKGLKKAKPPES